MLNTLRDKSNTVYGIKPYNEAIDFCKKHNIPINLKCINNNSKEATNRMGYARKVSADLYIDDRNIGFIGWFLRLYNK